MLPASAFYTDPTLVQTAALVSTTAAASAAAAAAAATAVNGGGAVGGGGGAATAAAAVATQQQHSSTTTPSNETNPTGSSTRDTTLTKIFVGGLPYHTTDKTLHDYFRQFGDIEEAVVITDRQTQKSRGYGFVTMKERSDAEKACRDPNPIIDGRKANVNLAYLGAKPRNNVHLAAIQQHVLSQFQQPSAAQAAAAVIQAQLQLAAQQQQQQQQQNAAAAAAAAAFAARFTNGGGAGAGAAAGCAPTAAMTGSLPGVTAAQLQYLQSTAGVNPTLLAAQISQQQQQQKHVGQDPARMAAAIAALQQQQQQQIGNPTAGLALFQLPQVTSNTNAASPLGATAGYMDYNTQLLLAQAQAAAAAAAGLPQTSVADQSQIYGWLEQLVAVSGAYQPFSAQTIHHDSWTGNGGGHASAAGRGHHVHGSGGGSSYGGHGKKGSGGYD